MPHCIQCKINLPSISSLGLHFKIVHKKHVFSTYQCGENNCNRTFSQWAILKIHLMKKHSVLSVINQSTILSLEETQNEENLDIHYPASEKNVIASNNISFNNFKTYVQNQADIFVAKLYNNFYVPRCYVQTMLNDIKWHLFDDTFSIVSDKIKYVFISEDSNVAIKNKIDCMFNTITNSFTHLSIEYKIFKHFKTCGEYIPPRDYLIGNRLERVKTQKSIQAKQVPVYGQFIELKKVL